ncbi:hypothetical protein [Pseudonocardia phyllosphaerae]|uniref:hypothetical protein n=1 Tax=Pseudonocardia phyllosphaerae TaxID=3390502 RepID=UPI00397D0D79
MTDLLTPIIAGVLFLILTAVVIGVTESAQRRAWRDIAEERRRNWERRNRESRRSGPVESWSDEDTD